MPKLLDSETLSQVKAVFNELDGSVEIVYFGSSNDCQYCEQTEQLLSEITDLSEKVNLKKYILEVDISQVAKYKVRKAPFLIVGKKVGNETLDYGVYFAGIPAGHEFTSLITAIMMVSTQKLNLKESSKDTLRSLTSPMDIKVFTTPTCPYCPQAVILGHQMAMLNPRITATMVDAIEFQDEASQLGVQGVPHTSINDGAGTLIGAEPEEVVVNEILKVAKIKGE